MDNLFEGAEQWGDSKENNDLGSSFSPVWTANNVQTPKEDSTFDCRTSSTSNKRRRMIAIKETSDIDGAGCVQKIVSKVAKMDGSETGPNEKNGILVAMQVDALNEKEDLRHKQMTLFDELQSEKITNSVQRGNLLSANTRNEILQKKVALLEKMHQDSKSQVNLVLNEANLIQTDAAEAEKSLTSQLARARATIKALESAAKKVKEDQIEAAENDAKQIQLLQNQSNAQRSLLEQRNMDLEKQLKELNKTFKEQNEQFLQLQTQHDQMASKMERLNAHINITNSWEKSPDQNTNDIALDARIKQLTDEARLNSLLRLQQKRIHALEERNKVRLLSSPTNYMTCIYFHLITVLVTCIYS